MSYFDRCCIVFIPHGKGHCLESFINECKENRSGCYTPNELDELKYLFKVKFDHFEKKGKPKNMASVSLHGGFD